MELLRVKSPDIDAIGRQLAYWGRLGRGLPRSWDGARHSIPVTGPQGEWLGRILPGRGFYSEYDLRSVGITRRIPHVFERSRVLKLADFFKSERGAVRLAAWRDAAMRWGHLAPDFARAAITTYDGIIAARAGGNANDVLVSKTSQTTVGNIWYSVMLAAGNPAALSGLAAGSSSANSGGTACTNATTGAWSWGLSNPAGGNRKYLLTVGYTSGQQINVAMIIDLLVGVSGIAATSTSSNINTVALPRYGSSGSTNNAAGAGVWPTLEVTTALSTTAANMGGTYTNQAGTASQAFPSQAMTASAPVYRLQPQIAGPFMQLASGDFGVQGVQTFTLSISMGGGALSMYLVFPLAMIPGVAANIYIERDSTVQVDGLTELVSNTSTYVIGCLGAFVLPNATSTGVHSWFLRTCAG